MKTLPVTADFAIDGVAAGENLASRFRSVGPGILEYRFERPIAALSRGVLTVAVADRQGNISRVERTIRVGTK